MAGEEVVAVETAEETEATAQTVEIVPNAATEATSVAEDVAIVDVDALTSEAATVVVVAVVVVAATLQTSPTRVLSRVSAHDALSHQRERLMLTLFLKRKPVESTHKNTVRRLHHRWKDWNESNLFLFLKIYGLKRRNQNGLTCS